MKKLSIIDYIICVLILFILLGGVYYFISTYNRKSLSTDSERQLLVITVRVSNIDENVAKSFEDVYDITFASSKPLKNLDTGKVISKSISDARTIVEDKIEGMYIQSVIPNKYDVFVTVEGEFEVSKVAGFVKINQETVSVNDIIQIQTDTSSAAGTILSIQPFLGLQEIE